MRARLRESLFGWIGERVQGATVLDLFSGSGSLGIEALSRGAWRVTFVESSPSVINHLKSNLARLGLDGKSRVLARDAYQLVTPGPPNPPLNARVGEAVDDLFDLIVLDPPFPDFKKRATSTAQDPIALILSLKSRLKPEGCLAWEYPSRFDYKDRFASGYREKRFGESKLALWQPD